MFTTDLRMGEFAQPIAGVFNFVPKDNLPGANYFGLGLNEAWLITHLRDLSLQHQRHLVRPLLVGTTAGMSFSVSREDGVYADSRAGSFLRGGFSSRGTDADGKLLLSGSAGHFSGTADQMYEAHLGSEFLYRDSGNLELKGRLLGPGVVLHLPWRDGEAVGGLCHTGLYYEVEGELFGEPVQGIHILEQAFSPPGQTLPGSLFRERMLGVWNSFASVYEDGTVQYGHLAYGAGPFRYANIVDGDRHISCRVKRVSPEYRPDGLGSRIVYHLENGEDWECVVERNGTLMDLVHAARKQGSKAQVHKGRVNQVGDERARRNWYAILEWFPERVTDRPSDAPIAVPHGF